METYFCPWINDAFLSREKAGLGRLISITRIRSGSETNKEVDQKQTRIRSCGSE